MENNILQAYMGNTFICSDISSNGVISEVVYQYVKNGGTVFRKITSRSDEEILSTVHQSTV